ncbi:MAG: ABC transporter ATP-binding protein, partial [Acidimicrobiia bacterium]
SVTALSIMRLIPDPPGRIAAGQVRYLGQDLLDLAPEAMREIRGNKISMIFQEPMTSLNPVFTVGDQLGEAVRLHQHKNRAEARQIAMEMLRTVGIPAPEQRVDNYPHQMSGGMRQRVMIAMALSCSPKLLIADEPTTALDVTIQAQILDLMRDLRSEFGMAIILITHDLGIVAEMAERVAVMYAGQIVEEADTKTLFADPKHPYTRGLIGSIPVIGTRKESLEVIPGRVPNLIDLPPGCRFAPRCRARIEADCTICTHEAPDLIEVEPGHKVRCWLYSEDRAAREADLARTKATV